MKIMKGVEIPIAICISYTLLSVGNSILGLISGWEPNNLNSVAMFLFCSIAVGVLSLHRFFECFSPLAMILIQYVIALSAVFLVVFVIGIFNPVSKGGYWDIFISFTIPYVIGAIFYYVEVFRLVHKQNEMLSQIKKVVSSGKTKD